jgi:hypothetical protein
VAKVSSAEGLTKQGGATKNSTDDPRFDGYALAAGKWSYYLAPGEQLGHDRSGPESCPRTRAAGSAVGVVRLERKDSKWKERDSAFLRRFAAGIEQGIGFICSAVSLECGSLNQSQIDIPAESSAPTGQTGRMTDTPSQSRIAVAARAIVQHLRQHLRFRGVAVDTTKTAICLTGAVLLKRYRHQAVDVARKWWSDILDHVEVWFWAFVIFHFCVDLLVFNVAYRTDFLMPEGDRFCAVMHPIFVAVLMLGLFAHLVREIWEEVKP